MKKTQSISKQLQNYARPNNEIISRTQTNPDASPIIPVMFEEGK